MIRTKQWEKTDESKQAVGADHPALKQVEAGHTEDVVREQGVSKHTIDALRVMYSGVVVSEAEEVKAAVG